MAASMLRRLCCSCLWPRVEDDSTVIPTETTHLIPEAAGFSSYACHCLPDSKAVDRRKLQDRMSTIVRTMEGKMVNVGARAPESSSSLLHPQDRGRLPSPLEPQRTVLSPPSGSNGIARNRYSSPSGSRSSSRRRTDPTDPNIIHAQPAADRIKPPPEPVVRGGTPAMLAVPTPVSRGKDDPSAMSIAFSWGDT
ncbi:hypothetical protein B0H12DRAFT_1158177 [Mycena haematopus]|nr:hypothetical protein B0H12DRAFT_1158177 [Mycena haematopus]